MHLFSNKVLIYFTIFFRWNSRGITYYISIQITFDFFSGFFRIIISTKLFISSFSTKLTSFWIISCTNYTLWFTTIHLGDIASIIKLNCKRASYPSSQESIWRATWCIDKENRKWALQRTHDSSLFTACFITFSCTYDIRGTFWGCCSNTTRRTNQSWSPETKRWR